MFRLLIFFFAFLASAGFACAQTPFLEKLGIEQGLSQGFISSIAQDDDGFLWFATKNGLNRYDGYGFQVFRHDPFDSLSLPSNQVFHVVSAGDFLYVGTNAHEIYSATRAVVAGLFHRKTHRFFKFPNTEKAETTYGFLIGERSVIFTHLEGEERVYKIASWPADLAERKNPSAHFEEKIVLKQPESLRVWQWNLSSDQKKLLFMADAGIVLRDIEKGVSTDVPFPAQLSQSMSNAKNDTDHYRIWGSDDGAVWIFVGGLFGRFDGRDWQLFQPPFRADRMMVPQGREKGLCWVKTESEIVQIDLQKQPVDLRPVQKLPIEERLISGLTDDFGNVWFGTDARGVLKFSPRTALFKNHFDGLSVYCQPLFNGKNHVAAVDLRPSAWNAKMLDLRTGAERDLYDYGQKIKKGYFSGTTQNGVFWLFFTNSSTKTSDLVRLDPETERLENFPIPTQIDPRATILRAVAPDQIWIISARKLVRFDETSGQFSVFEIEKSEPAAARAAERMADGTWWIGTTTGLIRAEPNGAGGFRFSKMMAEKGNRNSLPTNSIKSLLLDPADPNVLWIGTDGQGLSRFDIKKGDFQHITTKNGLPDDVVYGVLADDETPRKLWLSTNRGLARFSPETGHFQYFSKADGLPDNEFNTLAASKGSDGQLFFGTVNGLTHFHPKDLTANSRPPAVRFSGLKINGETVLPRDGSGILTEDIAFLKVLELPFSKNSVELSFAAMDFTASSRNQFAYFLKGAEDEWAHRGIENSAQYLNLAPGDYEFFVKASNSNGVWNEQPISIKIHVAPPFYRSWWAWLFYVAAAGGVLFYLYKSKIQQKLEHAEAERLKSLDAFKTRFFTNISHEFRTPLTVILGVTEMLENEERDAAKKGKHGLVKRSGENLLRLINQILDLAKLESSELKMNYAQGDVLTFLRYVAESMHSLSNAQNVLLRVESNRAKIVMDYDAERLLQIVHNLLSNAIKFTPSGGKIVLRADFDEKRLQISVADTGAGIAAEDLPHLFDRFFQAKNQAHARAATGGTGIGLSLVSELVKAMGGEIRVESRVGAGTTFFVQLPVTNGAPFEKSASAALSAQNGAKKFEKTVFSSISDSKLAATDGLPHVLLIEDNPDVVEYLANCLGEKYRLDFAFNGRAGIEKALETVPDLIVSDVMMPEKDGFEVCDFLKNDPRTSHVPVILLTARATDEDRIAGLRRGADAYLAKPFREDELRVWAERLIAQRQVLRTKYSISDFGFQTSDLPTTRPPLDSDDSRENGQSEVRNPKSEIDLEAAFFEKMRAILEASFADPDFSADALCEKMEMPRIPLHRKLHALTGRSIIEQINLFRLEKGRSFLQDGSANVSEAAFRSGFNDPKYFTRLFTKTFGHAPKEARKRPADHF